MIEARKISKFFSLVKEDGTAEGLTAVLSASVQIGDGQFVSLVGPSGCGKSTFLEILAGLQAPTEGTVCIDGQQVLEPLPATRDEMEEYRRKYRFVSPIANQLFRDSPKHDIAMIFQDYAVFPWMTAHENILFSLEMRKVPRRERDELARHYLAQVGLSGSADKFPSQMSGGMRQRLALARALSVEPKIILMDEPFAAVDTHTRERLQDDLLEVWANTRKTIVMVTHDIGEAIYLSDEIIVFSPQPGTIRNVVPVDFPRPRRRTSPEAQYMRERIAMMYQFDTSGTADCVI
jgi:NitT/TauT family transport system ATP-binding protein